MQPEIELCHWRILERETGSLHITAQLTSGPFRVTSALLAIDLSCCSATTESGRSYHLCAPPELDQLLLTLLIANALRSIGAISGDEATPSGVPFRQEPSRIEANPCYT